MLSALGLAAWSRAADEHEHKHEEVNDAVAVLAPMKASGVNGTIMLKQEKGYVQVTGEVTGYELPELGALQFVGRGALGGGVTVSLALDAHGKCLSSALLEMEIETEG